MESKTLYLIEKLLEEKPTKYSHITIPESEDERRLLLRALMNVREPAPIDKDFIKMQNDYLQEATQSRGMVDVDTLSPTPTDSRLYLWQGDITRLKIDAIVNAANSQMLGCFIPNHACIDNIIHSFAGIQLRNECNEIMQHQGIAEKTGEAKITSAYNLPSKYVIHTVGPIVGNRLTQKDCNLLESCYNSCIDIAEENKLESIAFCCISTGEFHFPNRDAAEIAVKTVTERVDSLNSLKKIVFNVFKDIDYEIYRELLG